MTRLLSGLVALFPALSTSLPHPQDGGGVGPPGEGGPPSSPPAVQSMTMSGPGCPIGGGGFVQQIRNGAPVFLFTEWNLAVPNPAGGNNTSQHSKWCTEQIQLANGPVGMQVRVAAVTIGGWADLAPGTKLKIDVSTLLGSTVGGNQSVTLAQSDLKGGNFTVDLNTQPTDIWSTCVGETGAVPPLNIRTGLTLLGTVGADGTSSAGVVGSPNKTDLEKALSFQLKPLWRSCPASAPSPV